MSELDEKYRAAQRANEAVGKRIRQVIAMFLKAHPEIYCCEENERILFSAMEAAEELSPTSLASWEILYAENRSKLIEAPAVRKQTPRRVAPAATGLTREEVNSWSANRLQREMESSPRRAAEIEAALSR